MGNIDSVESRAAREAAETPGRLARQRAYAEKMGLSIAPALAETPSPGPVRQPLDIPSAVRQEAVPLESNTIKPDSNKPKVVKSGFNKVAYQREYMRKRRAKP